MDEVELVRRIVRNLSTVAVLGAHPSKFRPAYYVPEYLHEQGVRILPVNPRFSGETLFGETVRARVSELDVPVDVVDVFRRPELIPSHEEDILAMNPLPKVVWLQSGIRHDEVAARLRARGITVIQDRCLLVDHRRLATP